MAEILTCPESDQLAKFALGEFPEEKAAALIGHVENCSNCATRLSSIAAEDSLVEAVRSTAAAPAQPEQEAVKRLLARVRHLVAETKNEKADQTRDLPTPVSNDDTPNFSWVNSPDQPAEEDDGLAPPKGPGEIGWLGPYRVLKVLGQGGMGKVFLAEDPALQRSIALKVMKPSLARNKTSRQRFLQEARAAAAIEHDNIIHIHQVSEDRGVPFVAMPLLKGASLDDILRRAGALKLKQTLRIGVQIAEGLAAAHERKLIHRDIKPGNIWIEPTGGGRVKILDFGLARTTEGEIGLTQSGAILGTPAYMPPEQARGEKVDHRADLYSLGCVLYRMATGEMPLKGNDTMGMLMALAIQEPTPPISLKPEVPKALSDLIMRLLAKDPAQRLGSAREVVVALKAIETGGASPPTSDTAMLSKALLEPSPSIPIAQVLPSSDGSNPFTFASAEPVLEISEPASKAKMLASSVASPRRRRPVVLIACAAVAACVLLMVAGSVVYRFSFQTADGTLLVEVNEDQDIRFKQGKLEIRDPKSGEILYTLKPGDKNKKLPVGKYVIEVVGKDGVKLYTEDFEIVKNGERKVRVTLPSSALAKNGDPPPAKAASVLPTAFATLDQLDPAKIPAEERFPWQPKELVAVLGEHRGQHWGGFISLSFSPDGKSIACSAWGDTQIFDAMTLREKSMLRNTWTQISLFSPDGKTIATSSPWVDGVWIWDISGAEPKKRFKIAEAGETLAFAKNGKMLAALNSQEPAIYLWDLSDEKPRKQPGIKLVNEGYWKGGYSLQTDGTTLATFGEKGTQLYDLNEMKPKERAKLDGENQGIAFSPDGKTAVTIATGHADSLRFWDMTSPQPKQLSESKIANTNRLQSPITYTPDGKTLLCSVDNDYFCFVDSSGPELIVKEKIRWSQFLSLSPDGKTVAAGSGAGQIRVWDWDGEKCQERASSLERTKPITQPILSSDGKKAAAITLGGEGVSIPLPPRSIRWWDLSESLPREQPEIVIAPDGFSGLDFSPDGKSLATCTGSGTIRLWDLTKAEPSELLKFRPKPNCHLRTIRYSPDGKTMSVWCAAEGFEGLLLWDVSGTDTEPKEMGSKASGDNYAWAPDGKSIVCVRQVKNGFKLFQWDLKNIETPIELGDTAEQGSSLLNLNWTSHGTLLINYYSNGIRRTYSKLLIPGETKVRDWLDEPDDPRFGYQTALAISSDAKKVAIAHPRRLRILSVPNQKKLFEWQYPGSIQTLSFTPDGRHLITANANGTAYVLRIPIGDDWFKLVAKMPAHEQVKAVSEKMKERNPGFEGYMGEQIEENAVVAINLGTDNVMDLSPIKAFPKLQRFKYYSATPKNKYFDISPLKGMQLTELRLGWSQVYDLSPLKGMPLSLLECHSFNLTDLTPLKEMPLKELIFDGTKITDLSPVKGMNLTKLICSNCPISDLSSLKGMNLTFLNCYNTAVSDLQGPREFWATLAI